MMNRMPAVLLILWAMLIMVVSPLSGEQEVPIWCGSPAPPPAPPPPPPPPPCCECGDPCSGSPNYVASGNFSTSAADLQLPTRGFPLALNRNYDSVRAVDGSLGVGWTSNLIGRVHYTVYLYSAPSTYIKEAVVLMPNGRPYRFRENPDGTFTPVEPSNYKLIKNVDGTYDLNPPLSRARYHYGTDGNLLTQTDEYGNSLSFVYDANGRLQQVSDASGSGRYLNIYYGADGRISTVQDSTGRSVSYSYDANGALSSVTDPALRFTYYSYAAGRFAPVLSQIKDHWNRAITTINYDPEDRTASYTEAGETYTYTYNYGGNPQQVAKTNSAGQTWVFTFDNQGLITSRVPPSGLGGGTTSSTFQPDGSVQLATDETGVKTFYTYNSDGSLSSVTRDYQGPQSVRFDYSYDPNFPGKVTVIVPKDPVTGVKNPDWQEWRYDYHQSGSAAPGALHHVYRIRKDETVDTLATYTYNSSGQVLTVTDAAAAVTTYAYDATTGDLTSVTYPRNATSGTPPQYTYVRDTAGRVVSVSSPISGDTTTYAYDAVDRITGVTLPKPTATSTLNFLTTYSYDNFDSATGLVFTHQTDPNGKVTKQGFDQYGQLVQSIDATNATTQFSYVKGLLSSITDANGNTTGYSYNGLRRLVSTQFPTGTAESYSYTADGLLSSKTDRKNQTISYAYDRLKRLQSKTYPNSASISYTYAGQTLMSVNDVLNGETHTFDYDAAYRMTSNTQGSRGTIQYGYDAADRTTSYSVVNGPTAAFTYYEDGSLRYITWSAVTGLFQFTYTKTGQYNLIIMPNTQRRNYSNDIQGRIKEVRNLIPNVATLAVFTYAYDQDHYTGTNTMLGQRTRMTLEGVNTKYYYDANYQLTRVDYPSRTVDGQTLPAYTDSWTYDAIGNRLTYTTGSTTVNYTYFKDGGNPNNSQRLQSDGVYTYTYDNNGNMITKTGSEGVYNFTWDFENRLTAISGPSITASYTYDYLGRRSSKTVNGVTTTYLYDGQNLIREWDTTTTDYVFGPGIDEPLALSRNGAISYFDVDALGTVDRINDPSAAIQKRDVHDAWGKATYESGTLANSFTYTARETAEAGLMYYRARYYQPSVGRFISEDPAGFTAGLNFYSYPANNPIIFTDPTGETGVKACLACLASVTAAAAAGCSIGCYSETTDTTMYVECVETCFKESVCSRDYKISMTLCSALCFLPGKEEDCILVRKERVGRTFNEGIPVWVWECGYSCPKSHKECTKLGFGGCPPRSNCP